MEIRPDHPVHRIPPESLSIPLSTFILIALAEVGDKSQLVCMTLAGSLAPLPVWLGATAALVTVSVIGVWAGRTVLQRLPLLWLHRISGGIFLLFALLAAWRAVI